MRGEVKFKVGSKSHSLRFTANRICDLEAHSGRRIQDWADELSDESRSSFVSLRTLFAAGLDCTEVEAGDIMDELGLEEVGNLIGRALSLAFAGVESADTNAPGAPAGKRKAAAR
ncbi:hypothetical protein [Pseudotabrizicola sp. 4114]|uniref:hypothetical protein n=1 Tax=Pseudotabrizicola sp. 4114 TaxID=2817731 RepID=UPI002867720C|nr:hypothetical protein [Pseudorhodobacter sp. 4114]